MDRRNAGLRAKKNGDYFENLIMFFASRSGFRSIKIPTGCKVLSSGKIVLLKSPFDFILSSESETIFIDAKSISSERFSYSMINQDQIRCLGIVKNKHNKAGYIIDFNGEVSFVSVEILKSIKPGESISREIGIYLGTIKEFSLEKLKARHDGEV